MLSNRLPLCIILFLCTFQFAFSQCSADFDFELLDTNSYSGTRALLTDRSNSSDSLYTRTWTIYNDYSGTLYPYIVASDSAKVIVQLDNKRLAFISLKIQGNNCSDSIDKNSDSLGQCKLDFQFLEDSNSNLYLDFENLSSQGDSFQWYFSFKNKQVWNYFGDSRDATYYANCGLDNGIAYARLVGYDQDGKLCGSRKKVVFSEGHQFNWNCEAAFEVLESGIGTITKVRSLDSTNLNVWDFNSDQIADDTGTTASYTYNRNKNHLISLYSTNGTCESIKCRNIALEAPFSISFSISKSCRNVVLTPNTMSANYVYEWKMGDGTVINSSTAYHTYGQPGDYYVSLTITDTTISYPVTKQAIVSIDNITNCKATFNLVLPNNPEKPLTRKFSSVTADAEVMEVWNFGDGSIDSVPNPEHEYLTEGSFTVEHYLITKCGDTCDMQLMTINVDSSFKACDADFEWIVRDTFRTELYLYEISDKSNSDSNEHTRQWYIGDVKFKTDSLVTFGHNKNPEFSITLVIDDNYCRDSITKYFDKAQLCEPKLQIIKDSSEHANQVLFNVTSSDHDSTSLNYRNNYMPSSKGYEYYYWKQINSDSNSKYRFHCDGYKTVRIMGYRNGKFCGASHSTTRIDHYLNGANAYFNSGEQIYYGNEIVFKASDTTLSQYAWDLNNDSITDNVNAYAAHTYYVGGFVLTRLEVWEAGFSAVHCNLRQVESSSSSIEITYCGGNSVSLNPKNVNGNYSYHWNFGDGDTSIGFQVQHDYNVTTTAYYPVILKVYDNGVLVESALSYVNLTYPASSCDAGFDYSTSYNYADPLEIKFEQNASGSSIWYFGDGDSSLETNPTHLYQSEGTFNVLHLLYNNCGNLCDSTSMMILVDTSFTDCHAYFEVALDTTSSFVINISNLSNPRVAYPVYTWDFGDGNTGYGVAPTHGYNAFGLYDLCLTVTDSTGSCSTTFCDEVGLDSNGNLLKKSGFTIKVIDQTLLSTGQLQSASQFMLYPNPASNEVTIKSLVNSFNKIELYSATGALSKSVEFDNFTRSAIVPLVNLQNGIYVLVIKGNNSIAYKKIIIQK